MHTAIPETDRNTVMCCIMQILFHVETTAYYDLLTNQNTDALGNVITVPVVHYINTLAHTIGSFDV